MGLNYEKAHAARRARALNDRLPEHLRIDLAREWRELEDDLHRARSAGAAELVLLDWRLAVEGRLTARLAHCPLEGAER